MVVLYICGIGEKEVNGGGNGGEWVGGLVKLAASRQGNMHA